MSSTPSDVFNLLFGFDVVGAFNGARDYVARFPAGLEYGWGKFEAKVDRSVEWTTNQYKYAWSGQYDKLWIGGAVEEAGRFIFDELAVAGSTGSYRETQTGQYVSERAALFSYAANHPDKVAAGLWRSAESYWNSTSMGQMGFDSGALLGEHGVEWGLSFAGGEIAAAKAVAFLSRGVDAVDDVFDAVASSRRIANSAPRLGIPATRATNPLSPVLDFDAFGNEVFYRAMKPTDYALMRRTGMVPATGETFISPLEAYSRGYDGVLVRITTKPGTMDQLMEVGVSANPGTSKLFPGLPTDTTGWGGAANALIKLEGRGTVVNTGLGKGRALEIFNQNIIQHEVIRP